MSKYIFFDIDGVLNSSRTKAKSPYFDCPGIGEKASGYIEDYNR